MMKKIVKKLKIRSEKIIMLISKKIGNEKQEY